MESESKCNQKKYEIVVAMETIDEKALNFFSPFERWLRTFLYEYSVAKIGISLIHILERMPSRRMAKNNCEVSN